MTEQHNGANSRPIRIVLADDHELVMEGLRGLIQREPDMVVVATVSDSRLLLDTLRRERPDVLVMDLAMPESDGFACIDAIHAAEITVKIVILSAFGDGGSLQSAWERNADGFALKTDPPTQTVATIRNVASGQIVFPRAVRQSAQPPGQPTGAVALLTQRERDVLRLLAEGLPNALIADRLAVQESTVKFHLQNIFQKLGVTNRTEAAQVYYRESREK
ncbi:MAG TPA: response regulator transcription factor [Roseiflexaceae bacterium]|nr:response regulator transcription factor [Roseiflexaceae bacterium]